MTIVITKKETGEEVDGDFYINTKADVYEYGYSAMAGKFDDDPLQLKMRSDLQIKGIKW